MNEHMKRIAAEVKYFSEEPENYGSGKYENCRYCEKTVEIIYRDYGFGYQQGSKFGYHSDMRKCCSECNEEI